MKNILIACLFVCLLVQVSFAMGGRFGLSLDAKTAGCTASINNVTVASNMDPMVGVGLVASIPLRETLSLLVEGQYNTGSGFTDTSGAKYNITLYPLQVSLQNNLGGLYVGGGINYTLSTVSRAGYSLSGTNGMGYQLYAGLDSLVFGNLELKYTYMTASASGSFLGTSYTLNEAATTISLGVKLWIN